MYLIHYASHLYHSPQVPPLVFLAQKAKKYQGPASQAPLNILFGEEQEAQVHHNLQAKVKSAACNESLLAHVDLRIVDMYTLPSIKRGSARIHRITKWLDDIKRTYAR